jgi:hypothetical protein
VAQPTAQPTLTFISLREARELVTRRYLSPALADRRLIEGIDDENEPVRWRYEHIENRSGRPTATALEGFWRPGVSTINWEENWAARKVEPPPVAAPGGVTPGGVVWASHNPKPAQPVSQLGNNFVVYGIRLRREDVERRLGGYAEPVESQSAELPPLPATDLLPPAEDETCLGWLGRAITRYPQKPGENGAAYHRRLRKLSGQAWSESHIKNSLNEHRRGSPTGDVRLNFHGRGD